MAEQCKAEMRKRRFRAAKAEAKLETAQKAYVATECDNLRASAARMIAKGGASTGAVFMKNAQALHEWLKVEKASNPQHWLNPLSAANIAWQLRDRLISGKVCETLLIKDAYARTTVKDSSRG